jgi:hypothetical protein
MMTNIMEPYTDNKEMDDYIDARLEVLPAELKNAVLDGAVLNTVREYLSSDTLELLEDEIELISYKIFLVLMQLYRVENLGVEILADTELSPDVALVIADHIHHTLLAPLLPFLENMPDEPFGAAPIQTRVSETSMEDLMSRQVAETTYAPPSTPEAPAGPVVTAGVPGSAIGSMTAAMPAQNPEPEARGMLQANSPQAPLRVAPAPPTEPANWKHVEEDAQGARTMAGDLAEAQRAAETVAVPSYNNAEEVGTTIPNYQKPLT